MKKIRINWKKALLVVADLGLMAYLAVAMGHLNTPDQTDITCKEVGITISDQSKCGFLSAKEVKNILTRNKVYPKGQTLNDINPRDIENVLKKSSLIYDVECHKTPHGFVGINVMQRLPVIRVKSVRLGDDVELVPVRKGSAVGFYNRVDGHLFLEEQACLAAGPGGRLCVS